MCKRLWEMLFLESIHAYIYIYRIFQNIAENSNRHACGEVQASKLSPHFLVNISKEIGCLAALTIELDVFIQ